MRQGQRGVARALLAAGLLAPALGAQAAGFALIEQSGSGMGQAYAGMGAAAEDASTIYYNPAGMAFQKGRQFIIAGHAIKPSAEFSNNGSVTSAPPAGAPAALRGGNGGDAGDWAAVPNMYYAMDINPAWRFGLGINAPFGLKTEYDEGWVGRYQALKSELKTVNINPSFSWRPNDRVGIGFGISAQYAEAELSKGIDFGTVCHFAALAAVATTAPCTAVGINPQASDGKVVIEGDNWSWGLNLGLQFQATDSTRIGIAYRSKVKQELEGTAKYTKPGALAGVLGGAIFNSAAVTDTGVKAKVDLPETVDLSFYTQVNPQWAIMGGALWTKWSRFNELRIRFDNGAADNVTPENWSDNWRLSFGVNYRMNDAWLFRAGVAYDESPVDDQFRTARIPDQDRTWLSLGAKYTMSKAGSVDFAWSHLFVKDASLNATERISGSLPAALVTNLRGNYDAQVDILSVQYTHNF